VGLLDDVVLGPVGATRPVEQTVVSVTIPPASAEGIAPEPEKPAPADDPSLDWESAFDRIEAGEKLSDVATDIGVTMPALRGRWAAEKKNRIKRDAEALDGMDDEEKLDDAVGRVLSEEMTNEQASEYYGIPLETLHEAMIEGGAS